MSARTVHQEEDGWQGKTSSENILTWMSQHLSSSLSGFQDHLPSSNHPVAVPRTHKCCAYIASKGKYCVRLNSIQAFSDINRDVRIWQIGVLSNYDLNVEMGKYFLGFPPNFFFGIPLKPDFFFFFRVYTGYRGC